MVITNRILGRRLVEGCDSQDIMLASAGIMLKTGLF